MAASENLSFLAVSLSPQLIHSGLPSFLLLVPVPSLLQPLGLDTSEYPFGSLPLLTLSGFPFAVSPSSIFYLFLVPWTCLADCFNLQIRVLDALFGPCSPGPYGGNCGSQVANSLTAKGISFLANWNMPLFPKFSPLLSLSAALQRLLVECTSEKLVPRPGSAALSLAYECPLVGD